ncbi:unnamed protein product, partial [Ixodes pacificus]
MHVGSVPRLPQRLRRYAKRPRGNANTLTRVYGLYALNRRSPAVAGRQLPRRRVCPARSRRGGNCRVSRVDRDRSRSS